MFQMAKMLTFPLSFSQAANSAKVTKIQRFQNVLNQVSLYFFFDNIKFTPFTTKYENKIMIIIICVRKYIIHNSYKIFLAHH